MKVDKNGSRRSEDRSPPRPTHTAQRTRTQTAVGGSPAVHDDHNNAPEDEGETQDETRTRRAGPRMRPDAVAPGMERKGEAGSLIWSAGSPGHKSLPRVCRGVHN